jgi:hypothetical protein
VIPGKSNAIIHPEYEPLHADKKLRVVVIVVFSQVIYADDLIQL